MRRYRTEIVIPADRTIVLHLPEDLPEGRAALIVQMEETGDDTFGFETDEDDLADLLDAQDQDFEWWEEFEDAAR